MNRCRKEKTKREAEHKSLKPPLASAFLRLRWSTVQKLKATEKVCEQMTLPTLEPTKGLNVRNMLD